MSRNIRKVILIFVIGLALSGLTWFIHNAATEPICGGSPYVNCDVSQYGRGWPVQYTYDISTVTPQSSIVGFLINSLIWCIIAGIAVLVARKVVGYSKK